MGSIENVDWDEWVEAIAINLFGTVYSPRKAFSAFQAAAATARSSSFPAAARPIRCRGISAYAASKAAVVRFTETLALEARDWNIDVNAIAPGALITRLTDNARGRTGAVGEALHSRMVKLTQEGGTPLGARRGALRLSGQRRERRPHRPADRGALGSLAVLAGAAAGDRGLRHLYAAPHRAEGSRQDWGDR